MTSRSDAGASDRDQRDRRAQSPHHSESSLSSYLHFRSHSRTGSNSNQYGTPSASGSTTPVQKSASRKESSGSIVPRKESSGSTTGYSVPRKESSGSTASRKESGGSATLSSMGSGGRKDSSGSQSQVPMSSSVSTTGSEATPTPSASALRRALAGQGNTSDSGSSAISASSKFVGLLHTLQPGGRSHSKRGGGRDILEVESGGLGGVISSRSASRAEGVSPMPSPIPGHAKIPTSVSVRAPYSSTGTYATSGLIPPPPAHAPPAVPGAPSPSSSTIGNSSPLPLSSSEKDNPWGALHVHVLPLFNRDPLKLPIEDLNSLVRRHMLSIISRNPNKGKAIERLESDVGELIEGGMLTLNSKLAGGGLGGVDDEKLIGRVVDLWGFFWDQVLPYVEGVFLPLQTDPYLLVRTPKRAPSPTHSNFGSDASGWSGTTTGWTATGWNSSAASGLGISLGSSSTLGNSASYGATGPTIDVRKIALRAFRDSVVIPVSGRLQKILGVPGGVEPDVGEYQKARLEQMLLVLSSISSHTISLSTNTAHQLSPNERVITILLRLVLYPPGTHAPSAAPGPRLPSFLSGGAPRDRRGRVMRRSWANQAPPSNTYTYEGGREALGVAIAEGDEREREGRELLESLRSPNPDLADPEDLVDTPTIPQAQARAIVHGGTDSDEDYGDGTIEGTVTVPGVSESLGTGPGGWGAKTGGEGARGNMEGGGGRRTAVYEDPELTGAFAAEEDGDMVVVGSRRPSRAEERI